MEQKEWLNQLASSAPTPGGGGASALVGAVASALGAMVANLTVGKKKYELYEADLRRLLADAEALCEKLYGLIQADAEAFSPLAAAYGIPKDDPFRAETLEQALRTAAEPPMAMLRALSGLPALLEELYEKGSRLALSDVGCAATFGASALSGALLNLLVNTRLMRDGAYALALENEARSIERESREKLLALYARVEEGL